MKNDRYFPLEICFWAGDNLSVMMYQIGVFRKLIIKL